jgi:signal peptidase I
MSEQEPMLFLVKGFSMWPFLKNGQKVIVKKIAAQEFRRGDLVLYRVADQLICHRLLRKEQICGHWSLYCRGDASLTGNDQVPENMVKGKVMAVFSGTKAVNLETRRQRLWSLVIVVFLSPILAFLNEIYQKLRKSA